MFLILENVVYKLIYDDEFPILCKYVYESLKLLLMILYVDIQ